MAILDTIKKLGDTAMVIKYKFFADDIVTNKGTLLLRYELNMINTNLTDMNDDIIAKKSRYIYIRD